MLVLCLFTHSAQRLALDAEALFAEAGAVCRPDLPDWFLRFPRRAEENKSLEAMGYVETFPPEGFRYRRTW